MSRPKFKPGTSRTRFMFLPLHQCGRCCEVYMGGPLFSKDGGWRLGCPHICFTASHNIPGFNHWQVTRREEGIPSYISYYVCIQV